MTILSLSRFMLAGVLLASFNASAIPGFWQQGYGQGNTEYSVTEASGKTFTINCTGNPDQNGFYQHSVFRKRKLTAVCSHQTRIGNL
ncbi:hypothetical protein FSJ37_019775, partial [Escherichia coli]|nr:hypothetical protein [Escherichia coli]